MYAYFGNIRQESAKTTISLLTPLSPLSQYVAMNWDIKLRNVDEELVRRTKAAAALKGEKLHEFVIAAIKQAVAEENKKTAKR